MDPTPYSTLSFKGVTSLSDAEVEALSNFRGSTVYLESLTTLNEVEAEALVNIQDGLFLNGLTRLSDPTAEVLSNFKGRRLYFNRLTSLSDTAAKALSKTKSSLALPGLATLGGAVAEALSNCKGPLNLNGLTSLSDAEAEALSAFKGGALYLHGLTCLSDTAAKALSNYEGKVLCLNGLTSLNNATAKALSNLTGELYLNGLTSLDDAATEALSNFKGRKLYINRLTSLSDAAAIALSNFNGGRLYLDGLTSLSDLSAKTVLKLSGRVSCSSIDPSELYLSLLGATASNYYDLKIDPNSGTVVNPSSRKTLSLEIFISYVFRKTIPSVIDSFEKEALNHPHIKNVDRSNMLGFCSAIFSMYSSQIFPRRLVEQEKFINFLEFSIEDNLERKDIANEFYYNWMGELMDYIEGNGYGTWNTSTLLFASKSLCPAAPTGSNPAISLAVKIRTFIELASTRTDLTFRSGV